jgi:ubiquitin carboxyl-terminal hydrolase 14
VQFVRFAWRKDTAKRAKILRTVSFPPVLDVRNLCTPALQASIAAHCSTLEEERDAKAGVKGAGADAKADAGPSDESAAPAAKSAEELAELRAAAAGAECHDNRTGRYELFAIITHQGRTAEGGHYVAWVKKDSKKWLVFDDETVAEISAERIKELYGGGDYHMAYVCLYRKMETLSLEDGPKKDENKLELREIETKGYSAEGADKTSKN